MMLGVEEASCCIDWFGELVEDAKEFVGGDVEKYERDSVGGASSSTSAVGRPPR